MVSHQNIANAQLIEFNSKLKLKAQNIEDINIILLHSETRKYDLFKLNAVQQTGLLNKIIISLEDQLISQEKTQKKNETDEKCRMDKR